MGSLLTSLGDRERRAVLQVASRRRYRRGEVVFHEGDPGDSLHVVTKGVFIARSTSTGGDVVTVNVIGEGDVFGELALLTANDLRSATVQALRVAETLRITRADFERLRDVTPKVDRLLVTVLAERNRALNDQLMDLMFTPVETRVHRRLLAFASAVAADPDDGWIEVGQAELAALAGTTRPSVNRALRRAERDGLVELGRGRIRIVDADGVAARAR